MTKLLILLTLLLPSCVLAEAPVPLRAEKVAAHSYVIQGLPGAASRQNQGFMSNAGFVVTKDGVVVFDTLGTPALAQRMIDAIRKVTRQPIRRVIVSHWHADHYYGLQAFKELGAEIWAHEAAKVNLGSDAAADRLAQRRELLAPWVNADFRVVPADLWLSGDADFKLGGLHFKLRHVGPAHSAEDVVMFVVEDGVMFSGDLIFKGRVPFVGDADSKAWLAALDRLLELKPQIMVPGHGPPSKTPAADLALTRDYLIDLRQQMGQAVADFLPFDEAFARADWSRWQGMPAYHEAHRRNAYNTYLLMERESLAK
ncbi:MAG: MBL fold metallo-hydrolase [Rhodocyclaceae bacterium]|nr:MBL fold metallo-hydrolase [Rhodocyclaceae bacterium]MDZ4214784.1 MBL fold metallo-hydrolase [Rhodocyclaceae bacterium]